MSSTSFKYCPLCATTLVEKPIYHALRSTCPACGFIYFLDPRLVIVVVVEYKGKLLLVRRNIDPGKGLRSFVSGYVVRGVNVEEAAIREGKVESNLHVQLDILFGI